MNDTARDVDQEDKEATLAGALREQWHTTPWYVGSLAIHSTLFLFLMLIPVEDHISDPETTIIISSPVIEEKLEETKPIPETFEQEIKTEVDVEVELPVTPSFEIPDDAVNTTDNDATFDDVKGNPDDLSMSRESEPNPQSLIGVGPGNSPKKGGCFGPGRVGDKRRIARNRGLRPFCTSVTQNALKWLAAHQESDGHWDNAKYGGGGHSAGDVGVTSLALLAFLGDGNSTRFGPYRNHVKRATAWLIEQQQPNGCIGPHRYNAGIALMAIAESYGMSMDPKLKTPAQKAVDWAVKSQCPSGGWNYTASSERVDTSVTGWWIMGLKSAKITGLSIPSETLERARDYIQQATSEPKGGNDGYSLCTTSYSSTAADLAAVKRGGGSARMSAVSNTCLQFLGRPRDDAQVLGTAHEILNRGVPASATFDFYRWYYASLGIFQMGIRSEFWKKWKDPLQNALLETQVKEGLYKENKGSWNFESDPYGSSWGRVGQTALGALMLEFRYSYGSCHVR